jgi:hypothetical protein
MKECCSENHTFVDWFEISLDSFLVILEFFESQFHGLLYLIGNSYLFFKRKFKTVLKNKYREFIERFCHNKEFYVVVLLISIFNYLFYVSFKRWQILLLQMTVVDVYAAVFLAFH